MTLQFVSDLPCQLCEYVAGRIPCEVLYDGPEILVLLNATNRAKGAVVVFPKRHVKSLIWATQSEMAELNVVLRRFTDVIVDVYSPDALHSWCSTGVGAGQTEAHMHFQLAPRYAAAGYSFARTHQLAFEQPGVRALEATRILGAIDGGSA